MLRSNTPSPRWRSTLAGRVARQRGDHLDAAARRESRRGPPAPARDRMVRLQRSITSHAQCARAGCTRRRKCALSSGAPPVRSSVAMARARSTCEHQVDGRAVHHLGAVRTGVDVAVQAALVAVVAEVDLQGLRAARAATRGNRWRQARARWGALILPHVSHRAGFIWSRPAFIPDSQGACQDCVVCPVFSPDGAAVPFANLWRDHHE